MKTTDERKIIINLFRLTHEKHVIEKVLQIVQVEYKHFNKSCHVRFNIGVMYKISNSSSQFVSLSNGYKKTFFQIVITSPA